MNNRKIIINLRNAQNIKTVDTKIEPPKISLPPGTELSPELMAAFQRLNGSILENSLKVAKKFPSNITYEIHSPDGNEGSEHFKAESENVKRPSSFFQPAFTEESEQTRKDKNPCNRIREMCVML